MSVQEARAEGVENSSSQDSLERLRAELETDLACVKAVVEEVVGGGDNITPCEVEAELASLPAGSRHGVGRQLSGPDTERTISPPVCAGRRVSPAAGGDRHLAPSPLSTQSSHSPSPPAPEQRRSVTSEPAADQLGARPRDQTAAAGKQLSSSEQQLEGAAGSSCVVLKQSSWGSRVRRQETAGAAESADTSSAAAADTAAATVSSSGNSFLRRKDLWERRSMSGGEERARTTPRPTKSVGGPAPDLVMDLPATPLASSPPIPAPRPRPAPATSARSRTPSSDSAPDTPSTSSSAAASRQTSADNFAAADTDTMRKHSKTLEPKSSATPTPVFRTSFPTSPFRTPLSGVAATKTLFSSPAPASATPKPAVKVKPILQVKPSEAVKKDNAKE